MEIIDIKALAFTRVIKEIETSFQDKKNMETILKFNEENNYEYAITNGQENNFLESEIICLLTDSGYKITNKYGNGKVVFKHYKTIKREEEEYEQIKEIRGY